MLKLGEVLLNANKLKSLKIDLSRNDLYKEVFVDLGSSIQKLNLTSLDIDISDFNPTKDKI